MMSAVIPFQRYQRRCQAPPLVFVEMYREHLDGGAAGAAAAVANCRFLIERARSEGWPVAFVTPDQRWHDRRRSDRHWIDGFRPQRSDMIFEPKAASCYSSAEFAETMDEFGMRFVLAGFLGESVCLATLIDAAAYGHRAGFIEDATACRPFAGQGAAESHRAVVATANRYAAVVTAARWLRIAGSQQSELELCHDIQ